LTSLINNQIIMLIEKIGNLTGIGPRCRSLEKEVGKMSKNELISYVILIAVLVLAFLGQVIWLVRIIQNNKKKETKRKKYRFLMIFELVMGVASLVMAEVFDSFAGTGYMPGLYWLKHWVTCVIAGIVFFVILALTFITRQIVQIVNPKI